MTKLRQIKRDLLTFTKKDSNYQLIPATHRGLVLCGGGSKGIAYVGMINALHERGFIASLTHISGASAGALTASLIATGMSSDDISKLIQELDIMNLLDRERYSVRAKGERLRNMLDLIYVLQIKKHMEHIAYPLSQELQEYDNHFNLLIGLYEKEFAKEDLTLNTIEDIINLSKSKDALTKMDSVFKRLDGIKELDSRVRGLFNDKKQYEMHRITFKDLSSLRKMLSNDKQSLIKNLSVVTTNQDQKKLETFNEELSPETSIAEVVQLSGAHPLLFTPGKNNKEESIADGGILNNMPSQALEKLGLRKEEILCVGLLPDSEFKEHLLKLKSTRDNLSMFNFIGDLLAQKTLGGRLFKGNLSKLNREKQFNFIDNMLYLNSRELTTTNMSPTQQQKMDAIQTAYIQANDWLDNQIKTFEHPLLALLYLDNNRLDEIINGEMENPIQRKSVAHIKTINLYQKFVIDHVNNKEYDHIELYVKSIEAICRDLELTNIQKNKAIALCLKQVDFICEGKLSLFLSQILLEESSSLTKKWTNLLLSFTQLNEEELSEIKDDLTNPILQKTSLALRKLGLFPSEELESQLNNVVVTDITGNSLMSYYG